MRSVSFVEHLELVFTGKVLQHALVLGNVTNEGRSQLVVGNISGDLAIFKGCNSEAWRKYQGLGMVSCIVIGDLCNIGKNVVFILTSEGWCHLMCFNKNNDEDIQSGSYEDHISTYHQLFPTNGKMAQVGDVDGDGVVELVVVSTDRVVRVFKWVDEPDSKAEEKPLFMKQSSKTSTYENSRVDYDSSSYSTISFNGKFVCVKRWKLTGQIDSLSIIKACGTTTPAILISQPGEAYIHLYCKEQSIKENLQKQAKKLSEKSSVISFTDCYASVESTRVHYPRRRRTETSGIPTYAIYWFSEQQKNKSPTNFIAICTLNGLMSVVKDEKIHFATNLMENIFTIQKLNVTDDENDELIFCSCDGETFIIDKYNNIINFKLGKDISAFCAGYYSIGAKEDHTPCFLYVTFDNRLLLYTNVQLGNLDSRNFNDMVVCKLDAFHMDPQLRHFIEGNDGSLDNQKIKQLTSWCLYSSNAERKQDNGLNSSCDNTLGYNLDDNKH